MNTRWSRRSVLVAGAAGLGWTMGRKLRAQAACTLTPELETGPYYVDYALMRQDIREGKPGVPLTMKLVIADAKTCKPLPGAAVDIWHCDALGIYSGYTKAEMGGPPGMGEGGGMPPPPQVEDGQNGPPPGPPPGGMGGLMVRRRASARTMKHFYAASRYQTNAAAWSSRPSIRAGMFRATHTFI